MRIKLYLILRLIGLSIAAFGWSLPSSAQVLTLDLESKLVLSVGSTFVTVDLDNTYVSPVIVCTYNLPSIADPDATIRIRNAGATSFEVRVQKFETNNTVTASDVHCLIADEGAYNSGGLKFEARTVLSDRTAGQNVPNTWTPTNTENVTGSVTQTYASPVVLGQVMTFNDTKASAFWTDNCSNKNNPPFVGSTNICVGKHIGMINGTRANETIGYIVAETGAGTINDIKYELALGGDSVRGTNGAPAYNYALSDHYDIGVASQNAMDGGDGSWAVLYGASPLAGNNIGLAVEEETFAGDATRRHTHEQVSYWVFQDNQTANITADKVVSMSSESASPYAIPGSDVLYTISASSTGSKSVDNDSVEIIDVMPAEAAFYNGDIDGAGPETGTVVFTSTGSGLTFNEATDLAFSNAAIKPANFAACSYTPSAGYDPDVTFICLNPKGQFKAGSLATSEFSVQFRVQVK